jgi:CheY-like chemotaxis protein
LTRAGNAGVVICRHVTGALLAGQRYACITVRDNGSGMPLEVVQRAFEPFFTTKDKAKGTGLGLAVVKSIVGAHDGAVVITSGPEYGTRFQVYLPESDEAVQAITVSKDLSSIRGRERILIVDDEIDVADAMSLALHKFGYETAPVYGSTEALEIFAEDPMAWDVVVTDQMMPHMKGIQLTRKLKRLNAGVEVVLCTGYSDSLTEQKAKLAGASAFLYKPAAPELVAQVIRQSMARKGATPS